MTDVLGDMSKQQSNDFSKIQARFANRLKLTSADVAEVIQKRLLAKNDDGRQLLRGVYAQQANNFKTLFEFADGGQRYHNFRDEEHFIRSEEHTSELQSLMRISYAVFCLKKNK